VVFNKERKRKVTKKTLKKLKKDFTFFKRIENYLSFSQSNEQDLIITLINGTGG